MLLLKLLLLLVLLVRIHHSQVRELETLSAEDRLESGRELGLLQAWLLEEKLEECKLLHPNLWLLWLLLRRIVLVKTRLLLLLRLLLERRLGKHGVLWLLWLLLLLLGLLLLGLSMECWVAVCVGRNGGKGQSRRRHGYLARLWL